jgi:peptidoglycan/LPS O-acetylase OafA/YrhL
LSCELAFYAALPFVAPRLLAAPERQLRRTGVATGFWTVVAALLALWLPLVWWPPVRAPEFLAGVLLAVWMRRGWRPGPRTRMIGVVATMVFVALTVSPLGVAQAVLPPLAVPACLWLIATTAQRDLAREPSDRSTFTSVLRPLGQWSYPLYLTHWIVVVVISRFLLGPWGIPLAVLASVAVAAAVHFIVEAPAQVAWRSPRVPRDVDLPTPLPSVDAGGP